MSEVVEVLWDTEATDNAVLLLAAAEELNLGQEAVKTTSGAFLVPVEVYERAFPPKKATKKK